MYVLGLIALYTHSNSRTISGYSNDFYKETYCSCTSCIIKTLARSTLYLDNQLNKGTCNNRSMAFKLLKLRCPVYRVIRIQSVDTSPRNVFYCQFINNLFFYILITSVSNLSERYIFVNESIESNDAKRIELGYQNNEDNLRYKLHFDRAVHSRCTFVIYITLYPFVCFVFTASKNRLFYLCKKLNIVFKRKYVTTLFSTGIMC